MVLSKFNFDKIEYSNKYTFEKAFNKSVTIFAIYPLSYCRTLIQIGYEPLKPILVDTFFRGSRYAYPSIFKYMSFVKENDGYTGLFRGCTFKLCSDLTNDFCYVNFLDIVNQINNTHTKKIKNNDESDDEFNESETKSEDLQLTQESFEELLNKLMNETISRTFALIISYPLNVCFVRSCSQFIGRETVYNTLGFDLVKILNQGGLYDGFAPRLIADILLIWVSGTLIYTFKVVAKPDKVILASVSSLINLIVGSTLYPLNLTSNIMSVNHCNALLASKIEPRFINWGSCYSSLRIRNEEKRGSALIWRYIRNAYKPQAIIRPYFDDENN